jgi:hypothetical protein
MVKSLFSFFLILFLSVSVSASHIYGGAITYKYVSSTADKVTYLISVPIYIDCTTNHVELDSAIKIGIYNNDKGKTLNKSVIIDMVSNTVYEPGCSFTYTRCIELGTYAKFITLDTSSKGYFISYTRCCRDSHSNITSSNSGPTSDVNGIRYFAFLAPSKYKNNAPKLNFNPNLINTINIKNEIDWGATDSDGDSLIYEIAIPYLGGDNSVPTPEPTASLNDPISVNYISGYSYTKPFGNNGTVSIDRFTGKLTCSNSEIGTFAFCVEIKEYRKGILIGIYRKDFPLVFTLLPNDPLDGIILLHKPQLWAAKYVRLYWEVCPAYPPNIKIERKQKFTNWNEIVSLGQDKYYDDSIPVTDWYFYRVKAKINGKDIYSNIDSACFCFQTGSVIDIKGPEINIYPNPAKDYLIIKNPSFTSFSIYDITGNLVLEQFEKPNSIETKIDIQSFHSGLYFIVLKQAQGITTGRFIKE